MRRRPLPAALVLVASAATLLVAPCIALAQSDTTRPAALIPDTLFDATTRAELQGIVERAHADGLPDPLLVQRALLGASRALDATDVVHLVRAHADSMRAARFALGSDATGEELDAGATALVAGATRLSLRRLRLARRDGSAAVALVVLADVIGRGYTPTDAADAVIGVANVAPDASLLALQAAVARATRSPGGASAAVLREIAASLDTPRSADLGPAPARVAIPPRRPPR